VGFLPLQHQSKCQSVLEIPQAVEELFQLLDFCFQLQFGPKMVTLAGLLKWLNFKLNDNVPQFLQHICISNMQIDQHSEMAVVLPELCHNRD
jgi:hypothetical protein